MEMPEPHWKYSEGAGFAVHGQDADLSGSVSPSPATDSFSHWKECTSCPGGHHERRINSKLSNPPHMPNKNISHIFQDGRMELQRWSSSLKPDRLSGAESKLQLNLLMLTLMFALGRQHWNTKAGNSYTYGHPRAGLLPALTRNMLTCNWNWGLHDNSLFCFSTQNSWHPNTLWIECRGHVPVREKSQFLMWSSQWGPWHHQPLSVHNNDFFHMPRDLKLPVKYISLGTGSRSM